MLRTPGMNKKLVAYTLNTFKTVFNVAKDKGCTSAISFNLEFRGAIIVGTI